MSVTSIYRDFKLNVFKCISSCCIWSVFGACVSYCGQNTWLYSKACSILITKSSFCNSWKYTTFFVSSLFTVNFFSYSIFFEQIMTLQCCTMLLFLYQPNYTTMFYFTFCVPACRLLWSKKLYSIVHDCIDVTSTNILNCRRPSPCLINVIDVHSAFAYLIAKEVKRTLFSCIELWICILGIYHACEKQFNVFVK